MAILCWAAKNSLRGTASLQHQVNHWLNLELDLRSLFGLHVQSCTPWLRPRNSPPPLPLAFGLIYEGAIGQPIDRRHLFVTPWRQVTVTG